MFNVIANHRVHIHCDNLVVVPTSGKARDSIQATSARNIWMPTALLNIYSVVTHIPGIDNGVAKLLSRWQGTTSCFSNLYEYIPCPIWTRMHIDHMLLHYDI